MKQKERIQKINRTLDVVYFMFLTFMVGFAVAVGFHAMKAAGILLLAETATIFSAILLEKKKKACRILLKKTAMRKAREKELLKAA